MDSHFYYTGVGSREALKYPAVMDLLTNVGYLAAKRGWILRSGGAEGCDEAFECGCNHVENSLDLQEIFHPWPGFVNRPGIHIVPAYASKIAESVIPWWPKLTQGAKKLHSRNACQVLGLTLDKPSNVEICWTPGGADVGGTRTAIVIARKVGVPVLNIAHPDFCHLETAEDIVDEAYRMSLSRKINTSWINGLR